MTDHNQTTPQQPGDVPIEKGRKSIWDTASLIWAIPVVALSIALFAAWRNYNDQGPLIEVSFSEAAGIKAGETQLRYRDIAVGTVEDVSFSDDLTQVVASIRVEKELAAFIDEDARFWVVRPQVSARGVSGLDTVLSGVYIRGAWDSVAGTDRKTFEGLDTTPLLGMGNQGVTFTLRSDETLPGAGTPILYKGVEVGVIGEPQVEPGGAGVRAEAVIYEPHTDFVTTATRFWDISGFSFSLGTSGARLNFTSLASLVSGGITFDTIGSGGAPLAEGAVYQLFPDEDAARDDLLVAGDGPSIDMAMIFEQNLPGLSAGSAVELGGLRVGEVTSVNGLVDPERFGDNEVRLIASVRINPGRFGLGADVGDDQLLDYLDTRVGEGLRARLVNASLFTGGLKIELTTVAGATPASIDRNGEPLPTIPTAPAQVTDVGATAQGTLQRISDLPIEEVMQSVVGFLDNASSLIGSEDLQAVPAELTGLLSAVRSVAESDDIQSLPGQMNALLTELQTTSETLNGVVAELETQDTLGKLTQTIESANTTAESLPALVEDLRGVLAQAQSVPLADLSQGVSDLLASARTVIDRTDTLIAGEDVQAVPSEVRRLLASVREVTEDEAVRALPGRANALLAELQDTAATLDNLMTQLEERDSVARMTAAIDDVASAASGLPALVEQARGVIENAGEIPLQAMADQATTLLDTVNRLLDQDTTRALPAQLNGALTALRGTLEELRSGGLVANANATLASARDAAEAVASATETLPQLASDLRAVARQADATLADYSGDGAFNRETRAAIRSIEGAAQAVERLARTLERNPNSLILGR